MSLHQWLADRAINSTSRDARIFFLAEMSAHRELRARLEFDDQPYRLLWKLKAQSALEQHAPCLFQAHAESAFGLWLGSTLDTFALTVLLARDDIDAIASRLRRFTKFQDGDSRYFLRLGDPAALRLYIASIAHAPEVLTRLFGHKGVEAFHLHAPRIALSRQVAPIFEQGWDHPGRDGYLLWTDAPPDSGQT